MDWFDGRVLFGIDRQPEILAGPERVLNTAWSQGIGAEMRGRNEFDPQGGPSLTGPGADRPRAAAAAVADDRRSGAPAPAWLPEVRRDGAAYRLRKSVHRRPGLHRRARALYQQ
jgi:hypothetical protein